MSRDLTADFLTADGGDFCTYEDIQAALFAAGFDPPFSEKELVFVGYSQKPRLRFDHRYRWLKRDVARWFRGKFGETHSAVCGALDEALGLRKRRTSK